MEQALLKNIRPGANVIKLLIGRNFSDSRNKLECLSLASFFQPSLIFVGEARSLPYSAAPKIFIVQAPALPANIRLGWKILPGANTLASYENP